MIRHAHIYLIILILIAVALTFTKPAQADTYGFFQINPTMDTATNSYLPNSQPYSNYSSFQIGYVNTLPEDQRGWYKFNLTSQYPTLGPNALITSASFSIYYSMVDFGTNGQYRLNGIAASDEGWLDTTITWATQPAISGPVGDIETIFDNVHPQFLTWALTSAGLTTLQTAYNANNTMTFTVQCLSTYFMTEFNSVEAATAQPVLSVHYTIPTPQGFIQPTFNVIGNGSITETPAGPYTVGSSIAVSAIPDSSWYFAYFMRDGVKQDVADNPHTFTGLVSGESFVALFTEYNTTTTAGANPNVVSMWNLPHQLAVALTIPDFAGQILATLILTCLFLLPTLFLCAKFDKNALIPSILVGMGGFATCFAIGWLPIWFFIMVSLLIALMFATVFRNVFTGGGAND